MIVFLLKSSACLAIFLMFYKLFLEKECMHTFKRYYLLVALVLALVIPSITFTEYVEVNPATAMIAPVDMITTETAMAVRENTAAQEVNTTGIDYLALVLWTLYGLGFLIFSLKFFFNLQIIARNIRNNPKLKIDAIINVLLKDAIVPHTFLNYIFLNRQKFECNEIPKDVLVHEATHARQKHSLDVLFVEVLQIVFWFNPLIHWAKKSIKLNHEFLADAAVIHQGSVPADYQNTLLAFASSANYKSNQPSMANAINYSSYSSIKKRFTVMKIRKSKKSILVKSLLVPPLFALLLYGFSDTQTVENKQVHVKIQNENKKIVQKVKKNAQNNEIITVHINKKGQLLIHDELVELENLASFLSKLNSQLSTEERKKIVRAEIIPDNSAPKYVIAKVENILKDYGFAQIDLVEGQVPFPGSSQKGATKDQISKYNTLAKKYNATPKQNRVIPAGDLKNLETIYRKMSEEQKADAQPFPECPDPKPSNQEGATAKQMAWYNTFMNKMNEKPERQRIIKQKDAERLELIYNLMTDEQKNDAEDFPKFVQSSIQEEATPEQVSEYNTLAERYNAMLATDGNIHIKKSEVDRLEYLHDIMTKEQRIKAEPFPDFPEPPDAPAPPAPPNVQDKSEKEATEVIVQHIIENQDPGDYGNIGVNPSPSHNLKKNYYPKKDHSMIRTVEEFKNKKEATQETIAEERPLKTTSFSHIATDKETKIYLNGKEITYAKMKKMERDGKITSMNIIKKPNGNSVIELNEAGLQPPSPPAPAKPKSPLELLKELKKDNVKIILDGNEIDYEEAEMLLKENTFSRVNVSKNTEGRTVLEVSTG